MLSGDKSSELKEVFKLNHTYYFEYFDNEDQFLRSSQRLIEERHFIIVFGVLDRGLQEKHKLVFFNQHYFPVSEIKKSFKEGSYFAFRSDLFHGYSLRNRLKDLGFLEYSMDESLLLRENDYKLVANIFELLIEETEMPHSEIHSTIIVSYLNLLLYHMKRFYQRSMESRLDEISRLHQHFLNELHAFFDNERMCMSTFPSLKSLSKKLRCTPRFLNDVSVVVSGSTAQSHIDSFIIGISKQLLAETDLSVAEIAERLKFEQPQSLTRLFKRKTQITPLDFRISII
ncbi:helix-turn-helix domain-containing protein [Sphingobacterium sp.]|uniref:helix-turn-helix domain-containing protein n=1 Tax=Sphingobacterium sp. TaxID=341027 RepID=UPI002FDD6F30